MNPLFLGFWLFWSTFIVGNAAKQAHQDEIKQEMKLFKEKPHRLKIKNI